MEVFFLDVAQGTCQVVLIGNRTAIVVDSGTRNSRLPLQFLKRMGIEHLAAILTTHSHSDHMGGATAILGEYGDRVDSIGFVQDDLFLDTPYWKRICEWIEDGTIHRSQLIRLECSANPRVVWPNDSSRQSALQDAALRVFAPLPVQNLQAQQQQNPNATSAVLVLDVGTKRIIFAADSEMVQWQDIHQSHGTIPCDVMSVPHHGGAIHGSAAELAWLYQDAMNPGIAIISLGTTNTYGHPREDVVQALTSCGAIVMCTQMTKRCSEDLESVRRRHLVQRYLGASSTTPHYAAAGNSRSVACAGSIRVEISRDHLTVDLLSAHQSMVDKLPVHPVCPLCRK